MGPVVENTKMHVVDALTGIVQGNRAKQLEVLHRKTVQESQKIFDDDLRKCLKEAEIFVNEKAQAHIKEAFKNVLDREMDKKVKEATENLQSECELKEVKEERQAPIRKMRNSIFEKVEASKNEATDSLTNEGRNLERKALEQMAEDTNKFVKGTLGPFIQTKCKKGEVKIKNLVRKAKDNRQKVLGKVSELVAHKVTNLILDLLKKGLPSVENSLKHLPEIIPEIETARKHLVDDLISVHEPVKPSPGFPKKSKADQVR